MIDHNKEALKERARRLSDTYSIEVGYESTLLDFDKELDGLIAKHDAGLVVLGMAARSFEQDLFGNTTTSLIMKLKYPVLAVPRDVKFQGIKKILFACDMLHPVHQNILHKIKAVAIGHGAEVQILHVHRNMEKVQSAQQDKPTANAIDTALEDIPHSYKSVKSSEVIRELEKEINEINADLLIMVPNKYAFPESLIHRSKTRMMASNNKVPLLSIPV
jgi:nucleotide-binding universal stress UspA family protein